MPNIYETTIIIDAHLLGEQVDGTIEKFTNYINNNGGKVLSTDRWGKRRLAYEIAKKQYGYYVYMRFGAEGTFIKELEREYKLDEAILRYLTIVVPKIVLEDEARTAKKGETETTPASPSPGSDDDTTKTGQVEDSSSQNEEPKVLESTAAEEIKEETVPEEPPKESEEKQDDDASVDDAPAEDASDKGE